MPAHVAYYMPMPQQRHATYARTMLDTRHDITVLRYYAAAMFLVDATPYFDGCYARRHAAMPFTPRDIDSSSFRYFCRRQDADVAAI